MIPYGKQTITDDCLVAVLETLRSDFLTTGPKVAEFEEKFAAFVGAKHAVAVCNATAALHLAMLATGIGPGDRVVTSPNTFLASANAAAFVGATPDFIDIDQVSYCLCPDELEKKWKPDTKAVVAVDYAGQTADMPRIAEIARARGAIVIEDACHAVGGSFEHQGTVWRVGGHPWADITTFSFHPVKTMTTGEGGMLVTDNDQIAARARMLRTHGMIRDPGFFMGLIDSSKAGDSSELVSRNSQLLERGPWYYEMQELGYNYRITDFQCALGISQLQYLPQWIQRRREIVAQYNEAFTGISCISVPRLRNASDRDLMSWHLYTVLIDFAGIHTNRTQLMHALRSRNVGTQVLYIPVYLQPYYRRTYAYSAGKCPIAEAYYEKTLSLPLYPAMSDSDVENVIRAIHEVITSPEEGR